jgi:Family of unknown function (DUF6941)
MQIPTSTGPFVAVATFCERVLREADNVVSILRVVDQLNVNARGPEAPDDMPPVPTNLNIAIILRRGTARGRHRLRVRPEAPGGEQRNVVIDEYVTLAGDEEAGANVMIDFSGFPVDREGLWWFDVLFGDSETLLARIPLRVNYLPQRQPG